MINWVEEIKQLRDGLGFSDARLAKELGFSKQYLSHVLTLSKPPSPSLKLCIWSRCNYKLSQESLLAFLPTDVAHTLCHLDKARDPAKGKPVSMPTQSHDWIADLVSMKERQGFNSREFADQLGLSQPFLSLLFSGKTPFTWDLKIYVWDQMNYDLSCDTLLHFLPHELAAKLCEMDRR